MIDECGVFIRQATNDDVAAIDAILRGREGFLEDTEEPPARTHQRIADHLNRCQADESHTVLVADDGREVLGYIGVHWLPYLMLSGREGFVSELFVAESARGRGVGSKLLSAVTEEAVQRECFRLMLLNRRTRESYGRGFYVKAGWTERHEFANFVLFLGQRQVGEGGPAGISCQAEGVHRET